MTRNIKIILIISLLLNALMVGVFAGHWTQSHRYRPISELSEIRPKQRNAIAAERARLFALMKEGAPDAEFEAQLEKLNDIQCKFNRAYMVAMHERLQKMPADKRARAIDKMMRRGPRHKH